MCGWIMCVCVRVRLRVRVRVRARARAANVRKTFTSVEKLLLERSSGRVMEVQA